MAQVAERKNNTSPTPSRDRSNMSDLRIVLLGSNAPENSRVGNIILNKEVFGKKTPQPDVETFSETVEKINITVISTTHLLNPQLSLQALVKKASDLCDPEPHVIILVLQHYEFRKIQRDILPSVLNCFGDQMKKRTMILTTDDEKHKSENKFIQQISTEYEGGRLQLQHTQCSQILQKVDEIITHSGFSDTEQASLSQEHSRSGCPEEKKGNQQLCLVLCGSDETLKNATSKWLREKDKDCVKREEKMDGRQLSVVELPALSRLSEEEVMRQTLLSVTLCHPGVHAFIIIVPDGPLTNDEKSEIEMIHRRFGSGINQHDMILITQEENTNRQINLEATDSSIQTCGGRQFVLENSSQVPDLLQYVENMVRESRGSVYTTFMFLQAQVELERNKHQTEIEELKKGMMKTQLGVTHDDVRIVVLGKTGVGKSATGNTILRKQAFKSMIKSKSVTKVCEKGTSEFNRRQIAVIDTPGLFDTGVDNVEVRKEIVKCVLMAAPGPHVFLLVIQLGRFTQEEKDAVKMIQQTFGDKSRMYTLVLFTRGDDLGETTIEDFLKGNDSLKNIISQCGQRYHVFNNKDSKDSKQVSELLDKIDCMVTTNGGSFYTNEMFEQVEKNIREEQERIMNEKEEENKRREEELRAKYEADIEQIKKANERERLEMLKELRQKGEEFKRKEEEIKKETDENVRRELQGKLEEQQKWFEEENKRKEKAFEQQQHNFFKYLKKKHEKDTQYLKEKIKRETRQQAESEYLVKLEKRVAQALKEAEEKHKAEVAIVLHEIEEKHKAEVNKALKEAEEKRNAEVAEALKDEGKKHKTEVDAALKEAEEKHKAEVAEALKEAEGKHKAEVAKALKEAEKKRNAEVADALKDAGKKHKTEVDAALKDAEDKYKKEVDKALREATESQKKEVDKALIEAEAKVSYRSKRARDWSHYFPVVGGAVGGLCGAGEDFVSWITGS